MKRKRKPAVTMARVRCPVCKHEFDAPRDQQVIVGGRFLVQCPECQRRRYEEELKKA